MKIIIISNTSWSLHNFREGLMRSLRDEGHELILLSNDDCYSKNLYRYGKFLHIDLRARSINPIREIKSFFQILKLIYLKKPQCVLTFTIKPNIYGSLAARILKIPSVINITGLGDVFSKDSILKKLIVIVAKISFARVNKMFFQNLDDIKTYQSLNLICENFDLLPGSGVDINKFFYQPSVRRSKISFIFIGRLLRSKGIFDYIAAAEILVKEYSNIEFKILGPISQIKGELDLKQISLLEQRRVIKYLGIASDVRPHIVNSDCVVLPSYYKEGVPRSLIEAASIGRPIITTDTPGCRDLIIENGVNGFLCKSQDIGDLCIQMKNFIRTEFEEILIMGKMSRELVEKNYDEKVVIKKYVDTLTKFI